ncbi:MAG: leucine-rich repeat domain-containing protein [Holosporales bacterium]|nr:leucine-rich repeat domain-containing protein [Holosporales bacterium]
MTIWRNIALTALILGLGNCAGAMHFLPGSGLCGDPSQGSTAANVGATFSQMGGSPPIDFALEGDTFAPRIIVLNGLIRFVNQASVHEFSLDKCWFPSCVMFLNGQSHFPLFFRTIVFESSSRLSGIDARAFQGSGLRNLFIPKNVEFFGESCFSGCSSLSSVIFEHGSQLQKIERVAFFLARLTEIVIPASVEVLELHSFGFCRSLTSVIFESGSQLLKIDEDAFSQTGLTEITIPARTLLLGKKIFPRGTKVIRQGA